MAMARVLCPVLVGRDGELSDLEDALLSALRGEGGVIIVGGEAGMGKSRLATEVSQRAERLGCTVLAGACSEADLALPYLPFLEAIGNHLSRSDLEATGARLGSLADELAHLFPQLGKPAVSTGDTTHAKLRLFEAILALLRDAGGKRGLLLVLEDLHWADPATRELLDYLGRRLRGDRVLVLATYRSDELHRKHPLLPTIQGWRRSGQVRIIELRALEADSIGVMVAAIFDQQESVGDEFRQFLRTRTDGNPFVLEEMLKDAVDRGAIYKTESGWDRKALTELKLPETVRDTILLRIERLGAHEVEVLAAASVIGRSFDLADLTAVSAHVEATVMAALQTCVRQQLLEEEDGTKGSYRFRHALTREAVYEDMVTPRRRQLHARVAEVLRDRRGHRAVELAHHLFGAGRFDEAVPQCVLAAEEAGTARAYRDAAELYERAAPHVQDEVERARLLCRAGDAYWNNSEPGAARRPLEEGVAALDAHGADVEAATWRLLLGRCFWELQRSDLARQQYFRALELLEPRGPSEALAIAHIRISGLDEFNCSFDSALHHAQRAAEIAETAGSSLARAWSWNFMALPEISLGQVKVGFEHLDRSYRESLEGEHWFQAGNAVYNAAWIAAHIGLGRLAAMWAGRGAVTTGPQDPWLHYVRALVMLHQGRVADVVDVGRLALVRSEESGHGKMAWRSQVLLAHILAEADRGTEADEKLPSLSSRVEATDAIYDGYARIRTALANHDVEGAVRAARTVPPSSCDMGSPADAIAELVDADRELVSTFLAQAAARGEVVSSPRLVAARGRLALLDGQVDAAVQQLREASDTFREEGFLLDAWHVERALGQAEFHSGDHAVAAARLQGVVQEAEKAGAMLAARLARETAASLGVLAAPPAESPNLQSTAEPEIVGERLVSVLFVDVRGYTSMTSLIAPAEMAERISTYQRWASAEVARHRGVVDKFAGDAVMAVFNVAGMSVDHAEHALQAAIAIRDKAALLGLPVGAGIAVGPAVVGRMTAGANMSVLGEVTNMAARLQAQSQAGEVTLSTEAYRRLAGWLTGKGLEAEPLQVELKGFDAPVDAYRIPAPGAA